MIWEYFGYMNELIMIEIVDTGKKLKHFVYLADSMDIYKTECWIQTSTIFGVCIRLPDFREAEILWTTAVVYIWCELLFNTIWKLLLNHGWAHHASLSFYFPSIFFLSPCSLLHMSFSCGKLIYQEEGIEDEGRAIRMGKRLLRSLALVFGCVAAASLVSSFWPISGGLHKFADEKILLFFCFISN